MSLGKIFGLYTICFLGVTLLIGIAEQLFGLSPQWIGWIFMGLSLGIYIVIGIITFPPSLTAWPQARTGCRPPRLSPWPERFRRRDSPALLT